MGALQRIETKIKDTQNLMLSSTKESAEQTEKVILAGFYEGDCALLRRGQVYRRRFK